MYKVSILVPIFKAEKYFENCVRSLFEQTYSNLEFVFVDDCTPDKSVEILKSVLEEYQTRKQQIIFIQNKYNLGAAASKNIAIDYSNGEFLCFVDADDWIETDAIEKLVRRQKDTNADVVWGKMMLHTKSEKKTLKEPVFDSKEDWIIYYINGAKGPSISNSRRIIRKELLDLHNIRFAAGFNYSEDRLLMNQVAYFAKSFSTIEDVVYHYNQANIDSLMFPYYEKEDFCIDFFLQEIGNLQLIEDFFSDKEKTYYDEAATVKMKYMKELLNEAIRYNSKDGFNKIIKLIESSNSNYWDVIGWKKNILWRLLHSNYYYRKYIPAFKKMIHD